MTIQITKPEVEALINQRLQSGAFKDAEDVILQALQSSAPETTKPDSARKSIGKAGEPVRGVADEAHTGADLVAAMQASPYREISLEPNGDRPPVRDVVF
jgi:hypothetical protein